VPSVTKKVVRREKIMTLLEANPACRVGELAQALGVSLETARRDLAALDAQGKISRTYGGAVRGNLVREPALAVRTRLHVRERQRIAHAALEHI